MPYFDPEPKKRREGFYDMEEELEGFVKAVERDKLIVVKGLRRYGETSLIPTGLNSVGARYVLIDCRLLPEGFITIKDFASLIKAELSRRAFGGVIGWLTYFGYMYSRVGKRSVNEVLDIASSLALQELEHALSLCSLARRRYVEVLKIIATLGEAGWSEIKRSVEARLGRIPDTALANILRNLVDLSMVLRRGRRYVIADNVLAYAIRHKLR